MKTLQGTPSPWYPNRMGWYYRPSQQVYEFWWQGYQPVITLAAVMLDVMPTEIVMEIRASVTVKQELID
jgi:hypothetical protein